MSLLQSSNTLSPSCDDIGLTEHNDSQHKIILFLLAQGVGQASIWREMMNVTYSAKEYVAARFMLIAV